MSTQIQTQALPTPTPPIDSSNLCRYVLTAGGKTAEIWTDWAGTIKVADKESLIDTRIFDLVKAIEAQFGKGYTLIDPFELFTKLHADLLKRFGKGITQHYRFRDWTDLAMRRANGREGLEGEMELVEETFKN